MIGERIDVDADVDARVARAALPRYDVAPETEVRLLNRSENSTFALTDPFTGEQSVLRVHRTGYHTFGQIQSELDWLSAVGAAGQIRVPEVLPARDGDRVVSVPGAAGEPERHVVRFAFIPGAHPDETALSANDFHDLGRITAQLHDHARSWQRPPGFDRFAWDWQHSLGATPRWGRWQDSVGVGPDEHRLLGAAQDLLHRRLVEYGTGADRFGLVHADLRLANLLVDAGRTTVIDFDDCGFSWYFYDFAAAVSFIEHDQNLPQWQDAWLAGYRSLRRYAAADEEILASLLLLRRLKLLAWMGTHGHAQESQTKLDSYAAGSCALAQRYLSSGGRTLH